MTERVHILAFVLAAACVSLLQAADPAPRRQYARVTFDSRSVLMDGPTECTIVYGPASPVAAAVFAPGGKMIASAGYREVLLWDLEQAKLAARIGGDLSGPVQAMAFSPDGRTLFVGEGSLHAGGAVHVVDVAQRQITATWRDPADAVLGVAVRPDGRQVAAACANGCLYTWDSSGRLAARLAGHSRAVCAVAFSRDGAMLMSGSADGTVRFWNTRNGDLVEAVSLGEPVNDVTFSPDSAEFAGAVGSREARSIRVRRVPVLMSPTTQSTQPSPPLPALPRVQAYDFGGGMPLRLAWRGGQIFAACSDGTIRVVQVGKPDRASLPGYAEWLYALAVSEDGTRLATGGADGVLRLHSLPDGKLLAMLAQITPGRDDWAIVSTRGFFAASSQAALRLRRDPAATQPDPPDRRLANAAKLRDILLSPPRAATRPATQPK